MKHYILKSLIGLSFLAGTTAFAGGYEKATMFSAKWSALAGAASAGVTGADALYFNPAGLAKGEMNEISANFSPTFSTFEAPVAADKKEETSEETMSPIFGVLGKYQINEQWAIGLGVFTPAGTVAEYDFTYLGTKVKAKSEVTATEVALGGGWAINNNWSVGLAWRMTMIGAEIVEQAGTSKKNFEDLSATNMAGFRLGAQYAADDEAWGVGFNYRSAVDFTAEGDYVSATAKYDGEVESTLPAQFGLGGYYKFTDTFKLLVEYTLTQYSVNDKLKTVVKSPLGDQRNDIKTEWEDQNNIRIAGEFDLGEWDLRAGYVMTTAVVPEKYAFGTYSTPGTGHSLIVGTGSSFMDNKMDFDVAGEYAFASGEVSGQTTAKNGDYSSSAYAIHTSLKYRF